VSRFSAAIADEAASIYRQMIDQGVAEDVAALAESLRVAAKAQRSSVEFCIANPDRIEEIKTAMRERVSSQWTAPPVQVVAIPEGGEPSTRSPASLGADTIVDPVFSLPTPSDGLGGTMMMAEAPPRPSFVTSGSQPPPPPTTSQPPPGSLAAALRAGLTPVAPSQGPAAPIQVVAPPRRSGASLVVTILLLLIVGALAAGGFMAWRTWKTHAAWPGSTTP